MPVLEELGVLDDVERAGVPKKWGATMLWGEDPDPWSWRFSETNRAYPHAYQVWRPTFDKILLDNARVRGVLSPRRPFRNRRHTRRRQGDRSQIPLGRRLRPLHPRQLGH